MRKMEVKILGDLVLLLSISMAVVVKASPLSEFDSRQDVSGGDLGTIEESDVSGSDLGTIEESDVTQESERIQVVLPTDFAVLMYEQPGEDTVQIQSQDIVLVNRSDFSVNVRVKEIIYELEDGVEGTSDNWLQLYVKEFQKEEYIVPCVGQTFVPFNIGLNKMTEGTKVQDLLNAAENWNPIGEVNSADYSILRLKGTVNSTSVLREKDVKVGIVFEFEKK